MTGLIEKLSKAQGVEIGGVAYLSAEDVGAIIREHEAEKSTEATQAEVERAYQTAMKKCLPNWGDGDYVDGGNLLALVSVAISTIGGARETEIGNHASTAHLQDHALTPPASEAYEKVKEALERANGWIMKLINKRQDEFIYAPIEEALAALPMLKPQSAAGEQSYGSVLVPAEITLAMQKAYFDVIDKNLPRVEKDPTFGRFASNREAYRAMLDVAPPPHEGEKP